MFWHFCMPMQLIRQLQTIETSLLRSDESPASVHLTEDEFTRHLACFYKVIRKGSEAVRFFAVITKDAVAYLELLQRHDMARE